MKKTVKNAGPDQRPVNLFPLQTFQANFAAIIIVIVAAAVAAAAKHFHHACVIAIAACLVQILEKVGVKSASVNGTFRTLPVISATC